MAYVAAAPAPASGRGASKRGREMALVHQPSDEAVRAVGDAAHPRIGCSRRVRVEVENHVLELRPLELDHRRRIARPDRVVGDVAQVRVRPGR